MGDRVAPPVCSVLNLHAWKETCVQLGSQQFGENIILDIFLDELMQSKYSQLEVLW